MASSKKHRELPKNKEEAIENLICAAIRLVYPCTQVSWDYSHSLVDTNLVLEVRLALRDLEKFH